MAAKHDGKHARANMWVTQQNLAKAKGGRPHRQFKERTVQAMRKDVPVQIPEEKAAKTSEAVEPSSEETNG